MCLREKGGTRLHLSLSSIWSRDKHALNGLGSVIPSSSDVPLSSREVRTRERRGETREQEERTRERGEMREQQHQ